MNERVARAIYSVLPAVSADGVALPWDGLPEETRLVYWHGAQKALAALRNPTDAMLAEGNRSDLPKDAANVWERMLYRALCEPRSF